MTYPVLKDEELMPCLKEMGVPLTAQQLAKPTPEVVRAAFENIVFTLMGLTREEIQQPVFDAIDELEFPELYDESIPVLTFHKYLCKLMTSAYYKDFSMKDLCKPEEPRLRRQLSAIVNYAKFREVKLEMYLEWQSAAEAAAQAHAAAEEENARLREEIRLLEEARAAEEPEVAQLRALEEEIEQENRQLAAEQQAFQQEYEEHMAATSASEAEALEEKLHIDAGAQEMACLKAQLVESPEALRQSLEDLRQALERERDGCAADEKRHRDLRARLETVSKVQSLLDTTKEQLDGLSVDMSKKKDVNKKVKALQAKNLEQMLEADQLQTEQQHLTRQKDNLVEKIARHEHQSKLKLDAAMAQVEEQQREKEAIQADNAATLATLSEHDHEKRNIQNRIKEQTDTHQAYKENVLGQYHELLRKVDKYHAQLADVMQPKPVSHTPLRSAMTPGQGNHYR